jgi:hypothetical protein
MNTTTQQTYHETSRQEMAAAKIVRGGSLAGGIAGGAATILAVVGLANILPQLMIPLATIVLGAAFLFEGGAIAARFSDLLTETSKGRHEVPQLGAGLTVEVVGGIVGSILAILALLKVSPLVLMPIAAVVYGVTLIFGSGVASRLESLLLARTGEHEAIGKVAHEAVEVSAGVQMFLGVSAVTLGILSLVGISPMIMNLVAVLCVGFAGLLTGSAISARMWSIILHTA